MFNKTGDSKPFTVVESGKNCDVCSLKPATTIVDGKFVCEECKAALIKS